MPAGELGRSSEGEFGSSIEDIPIFWLLWSHIDAVQNGPIRSAPVDRPARPIPSPFFWGSCAIFGAPFALLWRSISYYSCINGIGWVLLLFE